MKVVSEYKLTLDSEMRMESGKWLKTCDVMMGDNYCYQLIAVSEDNKNVTRIMGDIIQFGYLPESNEIERVTGWNCNLY